MNLDTRKIETLKNALNKPIVLIGMMGTGKTHLGKILAETLGLPFYDSDHVIEEQGGLTINEIFELYGEQRFRQSEEKTILSLLNAMPCIIATGGGAPMNPVILEAVKNKAISIWLQSDIDAIYERIKSTKNRPLLKRDDPKSVLTELLAMRESVYAQADIAIQNPIKDAESTLMKIITALQARL